MTDLSKPPEEEKLKEFAKLWNMPYRISILPYLVTVWLLPLGVGLILDYYNVHPYLIVFFVIIIVLVEFYLVMKFLKKSKKK